MITIATAKQITIKLIQETIGIPRVNNIRVKKKKFKKKFINFLEPTILLPSIFIFLLLTDIHMIHEL